MTAEIKAALAHANTYRKPMAERCSTWVRGRQCDNWRSHGSRNCAVHKMPERGA